VRFREPAQDARSPPPPPPRGAVPTRSSSAKAPAAQCSLKDIVRLTEDGTQLGDDEPVMDRPPS
jgi:hypothetical protein